MTGNHLRAVSKPSQRTLDDLTAGLGVRESRKLDLGLGHMAVCVARLPDSELGERYSIAHFFESSGGVIPDPEVVVVRAVTSWSPLSLRDPFSHRVAVQVRGADDVVVDADALRDVVMFCEAWIGNIEKRREVWAPRPR